MSYYYMALAMTVSLTDALCFGGGQPWQIRAAGLVSVQFCS